MTAPATAVQRLPAWPELLAAFVEERRHMPFEWGRNDCATFAADAVLAMTGVDVLQPLRGRWATEPAAAEVATSMGGLRGGAMALLGPALSRPTQAPRGAVVLARMDGTAILGVRMSGAQWCAPGAQGLLWRPAREVLLAWGI